jgi:hypothetical protein
MPVNQAIEKTYFYEEVRKTPTGAGVLYPGYPIYHLFKTQANGLTAIRIDEDEYWMPMPLMKAYIQYTAGDELVPQSRITYDKRVDAVPKQSRRKYTSTFPIYTHKYVGNRLYVSTGQTKTFPLPLIQNPYSYRNIQVWVESSQTYTAVFDDDGDIIYPGYWYHPFENRFYQFANIEAKGIKDTQFLLDVIFTRDTAGQTTDALMAAAAESIRLAQVDELILKGKTREQAIALVDSKSAEALATRAAQSNINPKDVDSRIGSSPVNVSVNVGNAEAISRPQATVPTSIIPKIMQITDTSMTPLSHEFTHRPNQVSYSSIGSDWSTIERSANRPIVDWKSYKLMQVSFSFLVANDASGTLDGALDGKVITTSVDEQLNNLRKIALSPYPIVFLGFDSLLGQQLKFPFRDSGTNGAMFVISDFSVTSVYRNVNGSISRASCDMTVTEFPHELVDIIKFPKIPPPPPPPPTNGKGSLGCQNNVASITAGEDGPLGVNLLLGKYSDFLNYMHKIGLLTVKQQKEGCPPLVIVDVNNYEKIKRAFSRWKTTQGAMGPNGKWVRF